MVTTRIAPQSGPTGFAHPSCRQRVDPMKLLALIDRLKMAAAAEGATPPVRTKPEPSAKAG